MRLIKLIAPAAMIAAIALFAPHADAQTMGEYATHGGSRVRRRLDGHRHSITVGSDDRLEDVGRELAGRQL